MSTWTDLLDEAARWREAGRTAELWWRDDDAADVGPALERLLAIHRDSGVPLALAVVPANGDAGPCRPFGRRAGRRSASAWLCTRQSRRVGRQEDRARHRAAGHAGAGRVGHRPHGARTAVRRASLAGAGAALEPHRAGPGADLAGDRLCWSFDLRCAAPHPSGEGAFGGQHPRRFDRLEGRPRLCRRGRCTARACCCFGPRARVRRACGRSQSSSCDGRRGVGFPKVDVAKITENAGTSRPTGT